MSWQPEIPAKPIECRNLVAGDWTSGSGDSIEVESPYTGRPIGTLRASTAADVDDIVTNARKASREWRHVPVKERTRPLFRFRELVLENIDDLSNGVALESGKTIGEAKAGILKGIEVAEFALSIQNLDDGGALEVSRGVSCETRREALGVAAGITPFNFPAMVPLWMYPIAVTLGNAFVHKPSEKVPLTACRMGELMTEAGYPDGVFNVAQGSRETVESLVDHAEVDVLGFVGSSTIARSIYTRATAHGKRALALGGAKNHLLVVPDADPSVTIDGVVSSFTGCAGQRCMAASLMIAVGEVDDLIDKVIERASKIELGRDMGAVIERASLDRLHAAIDRADEDGARVLLDGRSAKAPVGFEDGYWLAPSIIDHASPSFDCASRELFGPVLTIVRVDTLEEAMRLEQSSEYGNATSVFTTSGAVAAYVADNATNGMIGVNIGVPVPREPFSFGGTKSSRFGSGDITGRAGIDLWTQLKKITTKWELQPDASWMS